MSIGHHDVIISRIRFLLLWNLQNYHWTQLSVILSLQTNQIHAKQTELKRHQNTAHCSRSVKQTTQRAQRIAEHTVPDKNRSGALNEGRKTNGKSSEQRATERKLDGREVERATRNATKTGPWGKNWREGSEEVGKNCISRPQRNTQPNNSAVIPEQT